MHLSTSYTSNLYYHRHALVCNLLSKLVADQLTDRKTDIANYRAAIAANNDTEYIQA